MIERTIRETVVHNQNVLLAVPEEQSPQEYWDTLRREGISRTIRVRNPDGSERTQPGIFILDWQDGSIEITYFDGDEVAERFSIDVATILSVE